MTCMVCKYLVITLQEEDYTVEGSEADCLVETAIALLNRIPLLQPATLCAGDELPHRGPAHASTDNVQSRKKVGVEEQQYTWLQASFRPLSPFTVDPGSREHSSGLVHQPLASLARLVERDLGTTGTFDP